MENLNKILKEIIVNEDETYTIVSRAGWTLTANLQEVEHMMNKCYNESVLKVIKEYNG